MPKEVTYGEPLPYVEGQTDAQVPVVEVTWNRMATVQLVSRAQNAEGGRVMGDSYAESAHVTDGYHVDLDRTAINALIRHLRRARDQAFGRDE